MAELPNIVAIADSVIEEFGELAYPVVAKRAIDNHLAGDHEAAALWSKVAEAIKAIQAPRVIMH